MRRLAVVASLLLAGTSCSSRHAAPGPLLAYSNGLDLVVFDPAAATRRVLVRGHLGPWETYDEDRFAVEPTWSPDGKRIAFVMKGERARIDVVDVGSGRVRRISRAPGDAGFGYALRWSADGRRVTSAARRSPPVVRGARARPAPGAGPGAVTARSPHLVRDLVRGRRAVRARDPHGDDQIVVERAGLVIGRLTADRSSPGHVHVRSCCPEWSPDGRFVAFVRAGAAAVVGADGRRERQLLENAAPAGWSPDGRYLLVARSLGGTSLWLYEPRTGRQVLVARPFVRRDLLLEPDGTSWAGAAAPRFETVRAPEKVAARTVATPFPEGSFRTGRTRIRQVLPLRLPRDTEVADAHGGTILLTRGLGRHTARVAILGRSGDLGVTASPWYDDHPTFDRSGKRVLYRRWHELWVASVTGARRRVATDAGAGPVTWLRDGRIAYVDTRRRLVVGGRRYTLPRGTFAIAPDGARILYTKACDVWLANLHTGRVRRFAHAGYATTGESWSPDGTHVALGAGWWSNCDDESYGFDWYHAGTELFDLDGRPLDRVPGGVVGWSTDGRYLLTAGGVTGTEVSALQPLQLVDLRARTHSTLMPARSTGEAFVTGDDRIVFGRYDDPKAVHEGGDPNPRDYAGRLITLAG